MEKLIPKLRFPNRSDSWGKFELNDLFYIYDGTHQTPDYTTEGVPFVSVESIKNIKASKKFISVEAYEKDFKIKPQVNDILMTRITAGIIGDTAIVENDEPLAYYVSLALMREKLGNSVEFLNHNINSIYFKEELHKRIIHTAFPKKINLGEIGKCILSVPTLPEQTKIAEFLTAINKRIELLTTKKTKLTLYKQGVMQKIFNQELRFRDDNGDEFSEWEEKSLGEFAPLQRGFDLPVDNIIKGDFPVVFSNGILKFHNEFKAKAPGVVTGRSGTIGKVTFVEEDYWPHNTALWVTSFKGNDPKFVFYFYINLNLLRFASGSGVPTLNRNDVHSQKAWFPCRAEQVKIANFLTSLDAEIKKLKQQITLNKTYKKGLLQQMFV